MNRTLSGAPIHEPNHATVWPPRCIGYTTTRHTAKLCKRNERLLQET